MVRIFKTSLYTCECGYETIVLANSRSHSTTKSCFGKQITKSVIELVPKDEQITQSQQNINNISTNNGNIINVNIQVTYNSPDNTLFEEMKFILDRNRGNISTNPRAIACLPGDLLGAARDPAKFPGVLTSTRGKIIEKLPSGGERSMPKNKAVKTFANEAINAITSTNISDAHDEYFTKERQDEGSKKSASIQETIDAHATDSVKYHHKIPDVAKKTSRIIENHVEKKLNDILKANNA